MLDNLHFKQTPPQTNFGLLFFSSSTMFNNQSVSHAFGSRIENSISSDSDGVAKKKRR